MPTWRSLCHASRGAAQKGAAAMESPPSIDRTLAILSAFGTSNLPRRPADLAAELQIPRSSAYQIIRTLLSGGYLERVGRAQVPLGPSLTDLLIATFSEQRRSGGRDLACGSSGPPGSLLWSPRLTDLVDCSRFRRKPPYRIGFSNASTSNPWRRAMLNGMIDYVAGHSGFVGEFLMRDADDDPGKQVADIE
jgi:ribose transport system substrate-binding protein